MSGFFTSAELSAKTKMKVDKSILMPLCNKCKLDKGCKHSKIPIDGNGKKSILIIGSSPTAYEDKYGVALTGHGSIILANELKKQGISLKKDCWKTYAIPCWSSKDITRTHVKRCRPRLTKIIHDLKPEHIVLLGDIANQAVLGTHYKYTFAERWRGLSFSDEETKAKIHCLLDPYRMEEGRSKQKDRHFKNCFKRDVRSAGKIISKNKQKPILKRKYYEKKVRLLLKYKDVIQALQYILKNTKKIAFDYESTGLKPYVRGHKIVSISIAVSKDKAIAFLYDHTDIWKKEELIEIRKLWLKILEKKSIKKIAHNAKFEDNWSAICVGARPQGWYWDTANAAHIIDNRPNYTKLKFQAFIQYGIRPYDDSVSKYLKSDGEEFNTVEKADYKKLLMYNGLDSLFTFMLYEDQKTFFVDYPDMLKAMVFFDKGNVTMGELQLNGIAVNETYYKKQNKKLKKRVKKLHRQLTQGREARKFKKKTGRPLNITSNPELGELFYEVLGKEPQYTNAKTNNYKTDKNTIKKLNLPFVDKLIEMKELEKARTTNLMNFMRQSYKGVMHPFFSLNIPVSYRGSSSEPNFQNIPKRLALIAFMIRKGLIPSELGNIIGELDFSGAEVITSVCYHKDENFYNYLTDPKADMHRDNACDLWMLKPKQVSKLIRFFAKNMWTFAQFYGDWYGSCAPNLWENCLDLELSDGQILRDHMYEQGISELETFLEHCKGVEDKLWNERFPGYTKWKNDIVELYLSQGYIETFLGFRFQGLMSRNQCCNYPIQGTSFHMLVYTLNKVSKWLVKEKMKTKLIGQIHDSIISDGPKEEWEYYVKGVQKIVGRLQKEFLWLMIPMEIEAECSLTLKKDGSLAEMREYKNGKILFKEDDKEVWKKFSKAA